MKLHLTKPLVIFDLETTGLDLVKDRIIQISFIKVYPDGSEERGNFFVNPGKPIPHEVTELTGITDEKLRKPHPSKSLHQNFTTSLKIVILQGLIPIGLTYRCLPKNFFVQARKSISTI